MTGDAYAGETFRCDFENAGIAYRVSDRNKSALYEGLEPLLNGRRVVLLDVPILEQQLLGLVWRGGRIDHPSGEHDDHANAVAGVVTLVAAGAALGSIDDWIIRANNDAPAATQSTYEAVYGRRPDTITDLGGLAFGFGGAGSTLGLDAFGD